MIYAVMKDAKKMVVNYFSWDHSLRKSSSTTLETTVLHSRWTQDRVKNKKTDCVRQEHSGLDSDSILAEV